MCQPSDAGLNPGSLVQSQLQGLIKRISIVIQQNKSENLDICMTFVFKQKIIGLIFLVDNCL